MPSWVPRLGRRKAPLYIAIADALADDIAAGHLRSGDRVPAHRALAAELGIDFTTVSRAYAEARRRGLIVGRRGQGTFVRDMEESSRPHPGVISTVVDLSLNAPPEPEGRAVERELATVLDVLSTHANLGRFLRYGEAQGASDHREAAAHWIGERGVKANPDRIAICSGAQHAVAVILASLGAAGGTVLTEGLTFPAMKTLAQYIGARLVGVEIDAHGLRPDALDRACRQHRPTALCTVPTLHNPTASVMPEERRREIAAVARAHGLVIVEDDVYGAIPGDAPPPLTTYVPESSYYVGSLSKSASPGLRVAYALAPTDRGATQLANAVRTFAWMVAPLLAEIAARWIRDGTAARLMRARRAEAAARHQIATVTLGARLTQSHRHGSHGWMHLPTTWSAAEFVADARYRGVMVSPSDAFAVDATFAVPAIRVSLGNATSRSELSRGLRTLRALLDGEPHTGPVLL